MDLSPRDIQHRVRTGQSPEEVADDAGLDLARIQGFIVPVLAEREHMVERALATPVRRKHAASNLSPLGQLLAPAADEPPTLWSEASWDAWKRDDDKWQVRATFGDARTADFLFDPDSRYVVADSDLAVDLVGDLDHGEEMAFVEMVTSDPADRENTIQIVDEPAETPGPSAPVHSLKEVRERKAMEQLTIDLALDEVADTRVDSFENSIDDAPERPRRGAGQQRSGKSWSTMLFGSND